MKGQSKIQTDLIRFGHFFVPLFDRAVDRHRGDMQQIATGWIRSQATAVRTELCT